MHARTVSRGQHREHFAPPHPHRSTVAGALVAPIQHGARRPGQLHHAERRTDAIGDAAGPRTGHRDRDPGNPAGQLDVGVEVQPSDHPGGESVGGFGQRGLALFGRQRSGVALSVDGARDIQRRRDAEVDNRDAGGARDNFAVAGLIGTVGTERVDAQQIHGSHQ